LISRNERKEKRTQRTMTENELASRILDIAFAIHRKCGPGLFESVYEEIICYELRNAGLRYERQLRIPLTYENLWIPFAFRADLIIEKKLLVELKSVEALDKVHFKQVSTYLKLTNLKLALLINFNEAFLKNGIRRISNGLSS